MRFPSHRTALHSWWTVNLTGGTDGDTVREVQQSFPVRCSPEDSQVSPLHTVGVSGHCTGPVFLHSCLWVVHAHGCPLPFEIIGVFNFLFPVKGNRAFRTFVGPKTMGPQRRTGKHFEIQIYFCSPQMTTFLFENVWLSCSLRTQWVAAPKPGGVPAGRSRNEGFLLSTLPVCFEAAFWWGVCLEEGVWELQDHWASRVR